MVQIRPTTARRGVSRFYSFLVNARKREKRIITGRPRARAVGGTRNIHPLPWVGFRSFSHSLCRGWDLGVFARSLKPDGIVGPPTRASLNLKLHRLKPDGVFGPPTRVRLNLKLHRLKPDGIWDFSTLSGIGRLCQSLHSLEVKDPFSLTSKRAYVKGCAMSATDLVASRNHSTLSSLTLTLLIKPFAASFTESFRNFSTHRSPCSTTRVQEVMLRRYGFHQHHVETIRFRQYNASRRVVASTAARLSRSVRLRSVLNLGSVPGKPLSVRSLPIAVLLP
jgi:hypothetical protein